jgi:hypothetical protein
MNETAIVVRLTTLDFASPTVRASFRASTSAHHLSNPDGFLVLLIRSRTTVAVIVVPVTIVEFPR